MRNNCNPPEQPMPKKGFIAGAFDLLHPGHVLILGDCKSRCEELTVGLHVDPSFERRDKEHPVQTVYERFLQLKACKFVDRIIPYETEEDLVNMLKVEQFEVRFLGSDYEPPIQSMSHFNKLENKDRKEITGEDLVPIQYLSRSHDFSSTQLRDRLKPKKKNDNN